MSCSKHVRRFDLSGGTLLKNYTKRKCDESDSESSEEEVNMDTFTDVNEGCSLVKVTKLRINGVEIIFPGKPYPSQIKMMESVIQGLDKKDNNLIESPTGTGKTLALLCAVLAWKRAKNFKGKIYYTTRTHSQVSGVVKELKKTIYGKRINTTILGARAHLCVNPDKPVYKEGGKNASVDAFCRKLCMNHSKQKKGKALQKCGNDKEKYVNESRVAKKKACKSEKSCPYYYGKETGKIGDHVFGSHPVLDIEDYKKQGAKHNICPYFVTMYRHKDADLILCPYNYIISRQLRKSCQIDLEDSLVIFDEGHNLEKACCDEGSLSIKVNSVREIIKSCATARKSKAPSPPKDIQIELHILEKVLEKLCNFIQSKVDLADTASILKQLKKIGFKENYEDNGLGFMDFYESLDTIKQYENEDNRIYLDPDVLKKISIFLTKLELLSTHCDGENMKDYQLFISSKDKCTGDSLEIKCMNPAVVFKEIEEATTSVTITSGTLAPLSSYPRELGTSFHASISLEQSIPSSRYMVAKVSNGPTGVDLCLNFQNRRKLGELLFHEIGQAVLHICRVVPNGVILFGPSARFLNDMLAYWEKSGILAKIKKYKHVFNEAEKNAGNMEATYKEKCKNPGKSKTGALQLAYFRGTMSEGVDFKDEEARAVISVGIPFIPPNSAEARARKQYYSDQEGYWQWYNTDAFRAFNQGIGRCVRHCEDWGAVLMLEPRLLPSWNRGFEEYLPQWISKAAVNYQGENSFGRMMTNLKLFVNKMSTEKESVIEQTTDDEDSDDESNEEESATEEEESVVEEEESTVEDEDSSEEEIKSTGEEEYNGSESEEKESSAEDESNSEDEEENSAEEEEYGEESSAEREENVFKKKNRNTVVSLRKRKL